MQHKYFRLTYLGVTFPNSKTLGLLLTTGKKTLILLELLTERCPLFSNYNETHLVWVEPPAQVILLPLEEAALNNGNLSLIITDERGRRKVLLNSGFSIFL